MYRCCSSKEEPYKNGGANMVLVKALLCAGKYIIQQLIERFKRSKKKLKGKRESHLRVDYYT
jgi:hypothetical protein